MNCRFHSGQEVLYRLLAEVVIHPVDLVLAPVTEHVPVERERRGQIGAERLLHDDALPAPAVLEPRLVQLGAQQTEEARRGGEVEEHVAAGLIARIETGHLGLEGLEGGEVVEPGRDVMEASDQVVPRPLIELVARVELLDVLAHPRTEGLRGERVHRGAQ